MKIHFTQKQMVYVIKDLLSLPHSGSWMYRTVGKILTLLVKLFTPYKEKVIGQGKQCFSFTFQGVI